MIYAIPSYKRADRQETLEFLHRMEIPPEQIYIFVQTEDDCEKYLERYADACHIVLRQAKSIPAARNNILNYFDGDENILMMDDDVSRFSIGAKGTSFRDVAAGEAFAKTTEKMFAVTEALKGSMFGMYPVYNEFFMSDDISTRVTVNTVIGIPKGARYRFNEEFIAKEDIELCGRLLSYGKRIVRFNNIAFKAKHRTNEGGAHDTWKQNTNEDFARRLEIMYPSIFKVKRNNPQEVRLCTKDDRKRGIMWE